jgi:hypothetical protein
MTSSVCAKTAKQVTVGRESVKRQCERTWILFGNDESRHPVYD